MEIKMLSPRFRSLLKPLGSAGLGLFLLSAVTPNPARAYLEVEPTIMKITVPPGGTYSTKISLKNPTAKPMEVTRSLSDWKYSKPDGSKDFVAPGKGPFSCAQWISTPLDKIKLQPGESREVPFTLSVPSRASGGYYSTIVFGAIAPKARDKSQQVELGISIDVPAFLLVEIEKTVKHKGVIREFEAVSPQANRPFDIRVRFKNEGNVRMEANGRLSILDKKGSPLGWVKIPDIKTLPGDDWTVTAPWDNPLPSGQYKMVGTFSLSSGGILVKEGDFIIP